MSEYDNKPRLFVANSFDHLRLIHTERLRYGHRDRSVIARCEHTFRARFTQNGSYSFLH